MLFQLGVRVKVFILYIMDMLYFTMALHLL